MPAKAGEITIIAIEGCPSWRSPASSDPPPWWLTPSQPVCRLVKERVGTRRGHAVYQTRQVCGWRATVFDRFEIKNPKFLLFVIDRAAVALAHEDIARIALPDGGRDVIYALIVGRRAGRGPEALALRASLPIRGRKLCLGHLLLLSAWA
jgi:hypothetical protein